MMNVTEKKWCFQHFTNFIPAANAKLPTLLSTPQKPDEGKELDEHK